MKYVPALILLLQMISLPSWAVVDHDAYESLIWNSLKVDKPGVKNVFTEVNDGVDTHNIVIPAYIVKSWMKDDQEQPVFFLSAQPYVCEHSAIPYANQMVKIVNAKRLEIEADNGIPVYAFGNITIEENRAGLFSSAYTIDLHDIVPYQP